MKAWVKNGNLIEKGIEILQSLNDGVTLHGDLGRVLHAPWGATTVRNDFRLIIGETAETVVLMSLPTKHVTGDGWQGTERPQLAFNVPLTSSHDFIIPARKNEDRGELEFKSGRGGSSRYFRFWDRAPKHFDKLD